jgi:hypothetical protein
MTSDTGTSICVFHAIDDITNVTLDQDGMFVSMQTFSLLSPEGFLVFYLFLFFVSIFSKQFVMPRTKL